MCGGTLLSWEACKELNSDLSRNTGHEVSEEWLRHFLPHLMLKPKPFYYFTFCQVKLHSSNVEDEKKVFLKHLCVKHWPLASRSLQVRRLGMQGLGEDVCSGQACRNLTDGAHLDTSSPKF